MKKICAILISMMCFEVAALGQLRLASIFTDNMVLQQNQNVKIWGFAKASDKVEVKASWSTTPVVGVANRHGLWSAELRTPKGSYTTNTICVSDSKGDSICLANVLIGEVWLCSGQSNMEMILKNQPEWNMIVEGSEEVIARANNEYLRYLPVERQETFEIQQEVRTAGWKECNPSNAEWFSAVAYFFGSKLQKTLNVPVGLIVSSYGGSPIQSWLPESYGTSNSMYTNACKELELEKAASKQTPDEYVQKMNEWINRSEEKGKSEIESEGKKVVVPQGLVNTPEGDFMGGILYSKTLTIPQEEMGQDIYVSLGCINDLGRVYFNGEMVWSEVRNSKSYSNATFTIPASKVKPSNKIEVHVYNILWGGGLTGPDYNMYFTPSGKSAKISLAGEWSYQKLFNFYKVDALPHEGKPLFSSFSALYNGMISPLVGYGVKGFLWYQGEANVDDAPFYADMMKDMVAAWRNDWKAVLPFYFVEIAPFQYGAYADSKSALLREAQGKFAKLCPNVGMVSTIDLGNPKNIHPARKQEVGQRLVDKVLNDVYSVKTKSENPEVVTTALKKNVVVLKLKNTYKGLVASGDKHEFELSNDGVMYYPASVKLKGSAIQMSSEKCKQPRFVRYCWRDASHGTIFNSEGLPLDSFRIEIK